MGNDAELDDLFEQYGERKRGEKTYAEMKEQSATANRERATTIIGSIIKPVLEALAEDIRSRGYGAEVSGPNPAAPYPSIEFKLDASVNPTRQNLN